MGRRGPARKPTILKIAQGNPGHQVLNHDEPIPERGKPTAPKWLDDGAAVEFDRACEHLEEMGLLFKSDMGVIACYAQALSDIAKATKVLDEEGRYLGGDERKFIHPAEKVRQDAMNTVRSLARELGFGPAARSGIKAHKKGKDSLEEFKRFLKHG